MRKGSAAVCGQRAMGCAGFLGTRVIPVDWAPIRSPTHAPGLPWVTPRAIRAVLSEVPTRSVAVCVSSVQASSFQTRLGESPLCELEQLESCS